jgi:hypothetical protein
VERERAAEPERQRLDAQAVEPLDANRFVSAPDAEEDGLAGSLVDTLHHG